MRRGNRKDHVRKMKTWSSGMSEMPLRVKPTGGQRPTQNSKCVLISATPPVRLPPPRRRCHSFPHACTTRALPNVAESTRLTRQCSVISIVFLPLLTSFHSQSVPPCTPSLSDLRSLSASPRLRHTVCGTLLQSPCLPPPIVRAIMRSYLSPSAFRTPTGLPQLAAQVRPPLIR